LNRHIVWFSILILLAALFAGCGRDHDADSGESNPDSAAVSDTTSQTDQDETTEDDDDPVPVDVVVLGRGPIESVIRASATLEAESEVGVVAEAARRVQKIHVEEGDRVKAGQVLLRLQDEEQRSILAKTESRLAQAEREFNRQKSLSEQDLSSDQARNDAEYDYDQQKIALDDAKRELSYTQVRASIPGIVTARMVNVGDQVQIGQDLFHIIDFESLVARIYVPEKNLKQLHKGQQARLTARAIREEPYDASVLRVSPVVDPRTGTVKVTLAVGGQPGLRPGLFADVELVTAVNENALLVPKRALVYDNDQIFVYRLGEERKVGRLLVVPALADKEFIEPTAGLSEGDTIVIAGQTGLRDGVRVSLVGESEEPSEAEESGETEAASP
jgi:membrane fusion protein (multidrug efflux system)